MRKLNEIPLTSKEQSKVFNAVFDVFYVQHVPSFLSIILTWSIEGNLSLHILCVCVCVLVLVSWHINRISSGRIALSSVACHERY